MSAAPPRDLGLGAGLDRLAARLGGDLPLLLFIALVLFAAGLGLRDPWPADEPRFAVIARDMVHSGDWLIPRIGGVLYPDKPPVFMWLIALFYRVTGELRVAFLLPSVLAGVGMLVLVHDLARRLWDRRTAFHAGLLLLLTIQFTLQARTAQIDATLAFWTTLGLYGLVRHLLLGPAWGWYVLAWFAMGLGVITKGVGFLPALLFVPWGILCWYRPGTAPPPAGGAWRWAAGPGALVAAVALWLVPMLLHVAAAGSPELVAYRDNIMLKQTAERYADTWVHVEPVWYYIAEVIPWAWLPGSLALPWLAPGWWRRLRTGDGATWLLLGWVLCVLVFFSASPGKRGVYLLPAVPAFVLAAAPQIAAIVRRPGFQRLALAVVAAVAAVAVTALVMVFWTHPEAAAALAERHDVAPWGLLAAIAVLAAGLTLAGWRGRGAAALALLLVGLWQLYGWWAAPVLNPTRSGRELMAMVQRQVEPTAPLALVDWKEQFLLHLDRPVTHFGFRADAARERRDAAAWLAADPERRILIPERRMEPCLDPQAAEPVAFRHRREWMLAGAAALTGACPLAAHPRTVHRYDPATGR